MNWIAGAKEKLLSQRKKIESERYINRQMIIKERESYINKEIGRVREREIQIDRQKERERKKERKRERERERARERERERQRK